MMLGTQIMDMVVVSCDGKTALVDFDVWDSVANKLRCVRAEYLHTNRKLVPEGNSEADKFVAQCPKCLADVREVLLETRDLNEEKN